MLKIRNLEYLQSARRKELFEGERQEPVVGMAFLGLAGA